MSDQSSSEFQALCDASARGDRSAAERLMPLVYDELRRIARGMMRGERADHTLVPTALVNEAYLRLAGQASAGYSNRAHFVSVAAMMMRRVLVNHAEARNAAKRGNGQPLTSLTAAEGYGSDAVDVVALSDALDDLARLDQRQAQVVELKFFGGLENAEVAATLGISLATVKREWSTARLWLKDHLEGG